MKPITLTIQQAKSLAVRYSTYNDAMRRADWVDVAYWGKLLLETQDETGVTIATPEYVKNAIDFAAHEVERARK